MSVVDEIKARLDIVDVVSGYIPLKKAGRNYKAICPFHSEKTPSFVVNPERQSWRCFGACNEGGDIFSFVMKIDGYDFPEALRVLAERAGVELQEYSPRDKEEQAAEARLYELLDAAAHLYHDRLVRAADAAPVREYVLGKRGLQQETVEAFGLGYAPNAWDFAIKYFRERGYQIEELLAAGLVSQNDAGRSYDRFRHRLMIPIRDARGQTLGFGARALDDEQMPKYLNSPQGPLFDKSRLLYGFDLARRSIRESESAVVVEGYMDVIQAHQAGYHNVVAQMGTALTETQVQQIARYANRLILALDTDAAGQQATMRGLDVVRESLAGANEEPITVLDTQYMMRTAGRLSMDVRVLRLPAGKDPDDFIRQAPENWPQVVAEAQPLIDYVIEMGMHDLSPQATIQERERVARRLLPILTATENDLGRRYNLQQLATRLRIPESDLLGWALLIEKQEKQSRRQGAGQATNKDHAVPTENNRLPSADDNALERYCLAALLTHPDWLFLVNRHLRELARQDVLAAPLLYDLGKQDFSQEIYRLLYTTVETACYGGLTSAIDYIEAEAPPEIVAIARSILSAGRLEAFRESTSELHWTEVESILKEKQRFADEGHEQQEFLIQTLNLRLAKLKDERQERYFFTNTDTQAVEMTTEDATRVLRYARAQSILEQAIRDLTRRQTHQAL